MSDRPLFSPIVLQATGLSNEDIGWLVQLIHIDDLEEGQPIVEIIRHNMLGTLRFLIDDAHDGIGEIKSHIASGLIIDPGKHEAWDRPYRLNDLREKVASLDDQSLIALWAFLNGFHSGLRFDREGWRFD